MTRLEKIIAELPPSCGDFLRSPRFSPATKQNYAYDLRAFFKYVQKPPEAVTVADVEAYIQTLDAAPAGIARRIASLSSYYRWMYRTDRVPANIMDKIQAPRVPEKPIIRLTKTEARRYIDAAKTTFDTAVITMFLGTGIRVSELCGLDLQDVDLDDRSIVTTRKGGDTVVLYFGHEVKTALEAYLEERKTMKPKPGHENALFVTRQRQRITPRAVQYRIRQYQQRITPDKDITPHAFRATFATDLHEKTGDIYLVADVLGNKNVDTTRKHYAAISDNRRRRAAELMDED